MNKIVLNCRTGVVCLAMSFIRQQGRQLRKTMTAHVNREDDSPFQRGRQFGQRGQQLQITRMTVMDNEMSVSNNDHDSCRKQ